MRNETVPPSQAISRGSPSVQMLLWELGAGGARWVFGLRVPR